MPHMPPAHVAVPLAGGVQTMPQPPQFCVSEDTLRQLVPHASKPALQVNPHVPETHVAAPWAGTPHAVPHAPQFVGSVAVSVHCWLQSVRVPGHVSWHEPPAHALPVSHVIPHEPQLFGSDWMSTHAGPHLTYPASQTKAQVPPAQVACPCAGTAQRLPQPPQFAGSAAVSAQA